MQHQINLSLEKITCFFKNNFDIFKNKLMQKSYTLSPTKIYKNHVTSTHSYNNNNNTNTNNTNNNTHHIYNMSSNTISDNNDTINININMQTDNDTTPRHTPIPTTVPTKKVNGILDMTNYHFTHSIDYSKYTVNIISSVIDNMIDDIQVEHSLVNNKKDKKIIQKVYDYYDRQRKYSHLQYIMTPDVFNEFEQIINNVLCKNPAYLSQLYPIKRYAGDLSDITIRYGVFETNNFIIKIDDECDVFIPELELMSHLGNGVISPHNIVLPYFVRVVKNNKESSRDNGKYSSIDSGKYSSNIPVKHMHFSIQPRIKNTLSLRKWINLLSNKCFSVNYYVQMCVTVSKSILFMHSHDIVHGDLKPDNILIELTNNTPYIIDFGLSGLHRLSHGTGGTQPFCCPETTNCSSTKSDCYVWVKNKKQYDLWSIALIFSTIIIFKESYGYYDEYPLNYFTKDYYVNGHFLNRIPIHCREPFILVLSKKSDINLSNFITILENSLHSLSPP